MGMGNNFLSQEEINALLAGEDLASTEAESADASADDNKIDTGVITDIDKDLLGEIGNISMDQLQLPYISL